MSDLAKPFVKSWAGIVDDFLQANNNRYLPNTVVASKAEDYMRDATKVVTLAKFAFADGNVLRMKTTWTIARESIMRNSMAEDGIISLGASATAQAIHRDFPVAAYRHHKEQVITSMDVWTWLAISKEEMWDWLKKGVYPPSLEPTKAYPALDYHVDPKTGFIFRNGGSVA